MPSRKAQSRKVKGRSTGSRAAAASPADPGRATIEWLYREQLRIDDEWAVRTPAGFTWWADRHAQTLAVVGEETDADGDVACLVSVRTALLRNLDLDERALAAIQELMGLAAMAGPVWDAETRSLDLCSLVRVHAGNQAWLRQLISVAAVLQIHDARALAGPLAAALGAEEATSTHPTSGPRPAPDELATAVVPNVLIPQGALPSKWSAAELAELHASYLGEPPAIDASVVGSSCSVELPFGGATSLCRLHADEAHPLCGNGLLLIQSFPLDDHSDADGTRLALELNAVQLAAEPAGYGFGSFLYRDDCLHFTGFLPNVTYRPGLLPNLYFSAAQRARAVAIELTGLDWGEVAEG